jgi:hypothetical protein
MAIAGCGERYQWWKNGITQQEANRDHYECLKESQQRVSGSQVSAYGATSDRLTQLVYKA